ncbi:D-aspartate oxidase [Halyomorpha halys]|uniref:D-aspartate oxidase n=1 Tax=Halyomorpha halys TaxID=286706 RepID=UPI0006D4E475|nr:D-aspartate oxidase-like [Halyomorpha halys]XP_014293556.1 D-aspartate oxidase-like [Halyomorpha halys]XP_014293562.1 D-aspartate oxidase-like [Halyomorpha halys]XP_014293570.1 D-aspartate oxidase-like [Halyomorpha halys]XP_014293578.1 D-aspartate oxidase-like [Halyomorpha halys]
MSDCRIAVFGAGVVGLTTALELQQRIRNARITIIADNFKEDTTSDRAAGIFSPASYFSGPTPEITQEWINYSYNYYQDLKNEIGVGIKDLSGYVMSNRCYTETRNSYLEHVLPVYRAVDEDELASIAPGDWKYGSFMTTLLIECRQYQPWAMQKIRSNGGEIVSGRISSFSEVGNYGKFDVVMNCTGLGAKVLCNDRKLTPIRGQVFKVDAPWLDKFYYGGSDCYIIPGIWAATLGGTRNFNSWDTSVNRYDSACIWDKCTRVVPRLAKAPVLAESVGLRPHRDIVRVEPEIINGLKVVHNYGHGGYGVTSAPGTAHTATSFAIDLLRGTSSKL